MTLPASIPISTLAAATVSATVDTTEDHQDILQLEEWIMSLAPIRTIAAMPSDVSLLIEEENDT